MIHADEVKRQLVEIKATNLMWGRAELKELPQILFEGEQLKHVLNGRYEGGFAVLCATDQRVILIDKKPFYLTLEDTRYEMISDVQFNRRLVDSSIWIGTVHKRLTFRAYHHIRLRQLTNFIQLKAMESRMQPVQQWTPAPTATVDQPPAVQDGQAQLQIPAPSANSLPVQNLLGNSIKRPGVNPYKMPLMIRHRVSRFY